MKVARAPDVVTATLVGDAVVHMDRGELLDDATRHLEALGDGELRSVVRMLRLSTK